jgi:DNA repair exonuclease SbcCD ATPase subunit
MNEQASEQPEHAAKLQEAGTRLETTAEKADSSHTALETAQQGAKSLFAKNNRSITDSGAAEEEAKSQSEELTDAADQKRAEKESLQAQLQTWATSHRAARLDAMDRQRSAASTPAALWSDLD